MDSKKLIKKLEDDGWMLDRVNGSHHIFKKKGSSNTVPVPHPKKDLPIGTVRSILKRAGLL